MELTEAIEDVAQELVLKRVGKFLLVSPDNGLPVIWTTPVPWSTFALFVEDEELRNGVRQLVD